MVIDGIFFRTRAGCPWRDLPGEYGNWKTVYNRHRRWSLDGTWDKILGRLRAGCDEAEGKDWTVSADSTVVRAHQHAAGARCALPAELAKGGHHRMTRIRQPGRAGRRWAGPDPLRQARLHVPGHGRRRLDPDLATRPGHMICGTTPWRRPRGQKRW
jgi:transposase